MVAENPEDASPSCRPWPVAPEALSEPRALRRDSRGGRQDDGGLPRASGHRAVHPGCHEYCKFHSTNHVDLHVWQGWLRINVQEGRYVP